MGKKSFLYGPIIFLLTGLSAFSLIAATLNDIYILRLTATIVIVCSALIFVHLYRMNKNMKDFFINAGGVLNPSQYKEMNSLPLPIIVAKKSGKIIWYNKKFKQDVLCDEDIFAKDFADFFPDIKLNEQASLEAVNIVYNNKMYSAYTAPISSSGSGFNVVYFVNDDKLKNIAIDYFMSRPAVAILMIDNYEELVQTAKDSDKSQLIGEIDYMVERYVSAFNGLIEKVERDKFVAILEDCSLTKMKEDKFSILEKVKTISINERMTPTLSIGISVACNTLPETYKTATQSMDMALGRGGDQAAIKSETGFSFFGGVSKGVEKRTKVKTRIVAAALLELIQGSENVFIMGHKFSDLDCLGSSVGLYGAIKKIVPESKIVINPVTSLAKPLYQRLCENGYEDAFISPETALENVNSKSLLIITDTHSVGFLESYDLYKNCKNVVVIDHHRKMVSYIDNAVIFYHEPYASSASEMVAELVQYLGDKYVPNSREAEALLAGIMLDTKNFVLKTGVRTFEAAAYLRQLGADTIEVKKLFATSMDTYKSRADLVSSAEIYRNCAIAITSSNNTEIKIIAPQTADELLNLQGVKASFVAYEYDGGVSFSARSQGEMNVQVVMEDLGGGGHLTMAGAQLNDTSIDEAKQKLLEAIDKYYKSRNE